MTAIPLTIVRPKCRFFDGTVDRIVASDPAFSRLRLATRAMLSLLISAGLLAIVHVAVHPLPVAAFGLGVVISLLGSLAIRDATPGGQMISRLYAGIGAIFSVALAALLSPWPGWAYAAFLLLIFAAVYVRRYGARWFGVGMLCFMAYFMGDFLHPAPSELGWVALGAVIALAATHVVGAWLLTDDAERDFRRALLTIDRRIDLVFRHLRDEARAGRTLVTDRRALRSHVAQLREAVLMAEGFLPQGDEGALAGQGPASDLAVALFELQLFVERVVGAASTALPPAEIVDAARAGDERPIARWQDDAERVSPEGAATARLMIRVLHARKRLENELADGPCPAFAKGSADAPTAGDGESEAASGSQGRVPKSLHLPIQVTVASALALGFGLLLSPDRWYWAVITAFIVFNNAQSRTDTAVRALQRAAGTLGGLVIGSMVATLLAGHTNLSIAAILVLFFCGFYFLQVSYSVMIFCITVALALIYGVMGMFTPELLVLRLEETVIGGLAGAGVAFVLFTSRTGDIVERRLDAYWDALAALLDAARRKLDGAGNADNVLALSRAIDQAYSDLALAARPMGGPWKTVTRFGAVREKLLLLTGCAHWGRVLARGLPEDGALGRNDRDRIESVIGEIEGRMALARRQGASMFEMQGRGGDDEFASPRQALPFKEAESPAFCLEMMAALMRRLVVSADPASVAAGHAD